MDTTDLAKLLQRGYYVTLGATANFIEVLQEPKRFDQQLTSQLTLLMQDFGQFTDELATKGAVTEAEARKFVDILIAQQISEPANTTINTTATTVVESTVQSDLQDLTQQIAELRAELEKLRQCA